MSDEAAAPAATLGLTRRDLAHHLLRRLHSLTGVVPIGAFLAEHFYSNYQAVGPGGAARFDGVVRELQGNPVIVWLEIFAIGLPILYHALYGLLIAGQARYNARRYAYGANWRFTFQRVTGLILVAYIAYHVWMTRLRPVFDPETFSASHGLVTFSYMHHYLTESLLGAPTWIFYVVGVLAACFHLANGLWGFLIHWGITVGPRAQRVSLFACVGVGALLAALGLNSLFAFVAVGG
jgi:succinate dehydrogenase / fumarate reductase cytochrome b subunit